jgi:hypothetical protein
MIEHWIINLLVMSIPALIYVVVDQYKTIKKKNKIIELQEKILKNIKL